MKTLVLAEKPSVGRELARVLGCTKNERTHIEGKDHIVTWAMGHLVELADPEAYDEKYKVWSLDTLPMLPERMRLKVIKKTHAQFNAIKKLMSRNDIGALVIATDAGREGELVARWIMRLAGWKRPVKRLWISSQTDAAIRGGFASLKNGSEYENLFHAAECRAEADWIIGLNTTRALSCKYDVRLSAGRVQTPTLALIVEREKEIATFVPQAYWTVHADFGVYTGVWTGQNGQTRIKDVEKAAGIVDKVRGAEGVIVEVQEKEKTQEPPLAYDLTALQVDANRLLGFSAKKTLQTLQALYERHKIVTYPRTDSRHISRDIVPTLPDRLRALSGTKYSAKAAELLKAGIAPGKRFVDDAKVTDHHAIIPTEERVHPERLEGDERALWELVAVRFLEVLGRPYRYLQIQLRTEAAGETFVSRGIRVIDAGWRQIRGTSGSEEETQDDKTDIPDQKLAEHRQGEHHAVKSAEAKQGWTKAPPRYTEGTLVAAMENAGKFIEDAVLKKSIEKGGLGTPATRADIIEKIIENYYVERKGKELAPTSRGIELLDLAPEQLKSPELTAQWEMRLSNIARGSEPAQQFLRDIRAEASGIVEAIKRSSATYKPRNESAVLCPLCGKPLLSVKGKRGKDMLVCQGLSCGYEEEVGGQDRFSAKPSQKEKSIARSLMRKYGESGSETATLGDILKASLEKRGGQTGEKKSGGR